MLINPNAKHYKVRYKKDEDIAKIILKFLKSPDLHIKEAGILNGSEYAPAPSRIHLFT